MKQNTQTKQKVSLWQLFVTFFKVGAFTFGGGYAMIAILEEELISKKKWITEQDMLDMLVIAESTPGVIAVNTATSVGYKVRGVLGALLATLGVVLPSFCIIFGLSFAINAFKNNEWYQAAFRGIQACVTVLIVNAFSKLAKQLKVDVFSVTMLVAAFCVVVFTDFNVIFVILIGGVIGVVYSLVAEKLGKKPLPLQESERLNGAKEQNAVETDQTHADGTTFHATSNDGAKDTSQGTSNDETHGTKETPHATSIETPSNDGTNDGTNGGTNYGTNETSQGTSNDETHTTTNETPHATSNSSERTANGSVTNETTPNETSLGATKINGKPKGEDE